jgi:hypothetical protein
VAKVTQVGKFRLPAAELLREDPTMNARGSLPLMLAVAAPLAMLGCGGTSAMQAPELDTAVAGDAPADAPIEFATLPDTRATGGGDTSDAGAAGDAGADLASSPYAISISPRVPLAFPGCVGRTSTPTTFTVSNTGAAAVGPLVITIAGPNRTEFAYTETGCYWIEPGDSCAITVVFTAVAVSSSPSLATLLVEDAWSTAVTAVDLTGTSMACDCCAITPASGDVGSVPVGTTGAPVLFTFSSAANNPSGPLSVLLSSAEFVVVSDACTGVTIPAGVGTCAVSIALRPGSVGGKSATLEIFGPDGVWAVLSVTGTGLAPIVDAGAASDTLGTSDGGPICRSAAQLFACMWDDTVTLERTWQESQDMTIHGVITYVMRSAGANWCSVLLSLGSDAQTNTQSLGVRDDNGHTWYPQYYVPLSSYPWQVGAGIDIRYQVTMAANGRPRRALVLSSGGRVLAYQAEAATLEDLPPPPVALRLGGQACPSDSCGGGRYDLLAGSAKVSISYGQSATVDGYRIVNADFADLATGSCDSQASRISVAMVYEQGPQDSGRD